MPASGYTLVLNDPERGAVTFDFDPQPEEADATRPAQTTAIRLPDGTVYRQSFGQNLATLTLTGTFGYAARQVGGVSMTGFDLFLRLRRDIYDRYLTLVSSPDPKLRACTLEIHQWDEDEHWICEAVDFRTPRTAQNRVHYRYILTVRLLSKIKRTYPPPAVEPLDLFRKMKADLTYLKDKIGGVALLIETTTNDASASLQRNLLTPFLDVVGQVERTVGAGLNFINTPARSVIRLMQTADTALESLGSLGSTALVEAGQILLSLRRTLARLAARPGLLRETYSRALSGLADSLATSPSSDDSDSRQTALLGGENADRAAQARNTLASSSSAVRQIRVRGEDTLPRIAARELGSAERWMEIATLNDIEDTTLATSSSRFPVGSVLLVPADGGAGYASSLGDPRASQDGDEATRLFGRDFRLVEAGGKLDLSLSSTGDPLTVEGEEALLQTISLLIRTPQGTLLEEPTWGVRSGLGKRTSLAEVRLLKFALEEAALSDPRVAFAKAAVVAEDNTTEATLTLLPAGQERTLSTRASLR